MAKFISVLDSDIDNSFWTAVQWAETKPELISNQFYTAGVNLSLPKNAGDQPVGNKTITENRTGSNASVTMIKLSAVSANLVRLATNKASKAFLKTIKRSS